MTHDQKDEAEPVEAEAVADPLEEALRICEVGEYLLDAKSYSYGNGYTEPREYGIAWDWQQSKPDQYGQEILLAEAVAWHQEKAGDGVVTEATKLRSSLTSRDERIAELEMEQGDFLAAGRRILERGRRLEALLKEAEAVLRRTYDHIGKTPEYHRGEGAVDLMRDAGLLSARIYSTIRACKEGEG